MGLWLVNQSAGMKWNAGEHRQGSEGFMKLLLIAVSASNEEPARVAQS